MTRDHDRMKHDDDFGGLARDLRQLSRRGMLGMMARAAAGVALVPFVGACGDNGDVGVDADTFGGSCSRIPSETAGPYPGDGTNGPNILTLSGVERRDIRTSIGTATGTATGVEFTVTLTLVNAATCEPLAGYAVYLWHCSADGAYSMYSGTAQNENFLRGVQVTDAAGQCTFTTVFPGCYAGRWPHIHFEVHASLAAATSGTNALAVSQLALPKATCETVYATTGYATSATNLGGVSLASDGVFSDDGGVHQLATITGSVDSSLTGTLTVGVSA